MLLHTAWYLWQGLALWHPGKGLEHAVRQVGLAVLYVACLVLASTGVCHGSWRDRVVDQRLSEQVIVDEVDPTAVPWEICWEGGRPFPSAPASFVTR
jgi:hypothetical protein